MMNKRGIAPLVAAIAIITIITIIIIIGYAVLGIGTYSIMSQYPTVTIILIGLIVGMFLVKTLIKK